MMKYLIWSNEHSAWWKPAGRGYTLKMAEAGTYSEAEAVDICRGAMGSSSVMPPPEVMFPAAVGGAEREEVEGGK